MILAIDPGKVDSLAVAIGRTGFEGGTILEAPKGASLDLGLRTQHLCDALVSWVGRNAITQVVVEQMWHRPGSGAQAANKSIKILELQWIGGSLSRLFYGARVNLYAPHIWKGNTPKEICHARLEKGMRPEELEALARSCKPFGKRAHNVKDAAALLHFHMGRYK